MKIAYFINTFKSANWGGVATSNGLKYLLFKEYPSSSFYPLDLPELRFKKIKILRKYFEFALSKAILKDNTKAVLRYLKKLNIKDDIFDPYTHICFNGEGAIHYKSGHLIWFMGLLYLAKLKNKYVASINQTIDLNNNKKLEALISKIYNMCDFVSVREPISFELAKKIGIKNCRLIPDAVYGLPIMKNKDVISIINKYKLPTRYITMTGSSVLERNRKSIHHMDKILKYTKKIFKDTPIIFMANAKTDLYIAEKLKNKYNLRIINSANTHYQEAMAIIAKSILLVGGRQHPNIFAYIYRVPHIAFDGNTFKNEGVGKLQDYPIKPLHWDTNFENFSSAVEKVFNNKIKFKPVKIDNFKINSSLLKRNLFQRDIMKKQKNIAIIVTNLARSGAEKIALAQAKMFKKNGNNVVLFLLENIISYKIESFDFPIVTLTKKKDKYKFLGKIGDKIYAKILQNKMKKYGKFDTIISNLPRADKVVKQLNHPNKFFVIHMSYKAEIEKFKPKRAKKKLKLYRYIYKDENIITVAKEIISDFNELDIKYKNAVTIYNPFDFEYIRKKGDEDIDIDYDYIISPSAFRKQKRYDIMLDAFALVKTNLKLLILAKEDHELKKMIKERNLEDRVKILGFKQNPYKYIKNAKLLVLSSDREGLPTVIIESLILGTPVVSTDCPTGPREILIEELSRYLASINNSNDLSKKIILALEKYPKITYNYLEKFDKNNIFKQYNLL